MSNQVTTTIAIDLENRNRATVFWRGIIVFPVWVFVASFTPAAFSSDSGTAAAASSFVILPTLLAILFRGIYPSYVLSFNHAVVELETRLTAYVLLLNDDYPSIERNPRVAVLFPDVEGGVRLNRGLPLVKWFLAIPLYIVGLFYLVLTIIATVLAWALTSLTGKYPEWAAEIVLGTIAYWNRVQGYAWLLVTDEYPTFSLKG
ncbi:MAG: hypothetical protein ACKOPU_00970 [Candidatus Planktophila sp.]